MPHWLIKCAVQRTISLLPKSHVWNELLQEHVRKSVGYSDSVFETGLGKGRGIYDSFRSLHPDQSEFTVLGQTLKDLDHFPTPEEGPEFFVDYGETGPYVADVGDGECAAT